MNLRKIILSGVALLILAATFFLMQYLTAQKTPPPKRPGTEQKKYVRTEKVVYDNISTEIVSFGRVASVQPLDLVAQLTGQLSAGEVPLKEGQNFSKGQLLARISDPEEELRLKAAKSEFLKRVAGILPDFRIDFPDSFSKWEAYFKSLDLDGPLPELPTPASSAEKTYLSTRDIFSQYYQIRSTEERHRKYLIYAPYSGSFSEVALESGSFVNPGNRIARIIRTDEHEIKIPVEVPDLRWLSRGTRVKISTEDRTLGWTGVISRIGDLVNPSTQSVDVFVQLLAGGAPMYEGMYLRAVIPGAVIPDAMVMPRNAVFNGNQVFVIEQDSILRVKDIKVHKINQETVVISGLIPDADVVTEPLIGAYNNMKAFRLSDAEKAIKMKVSEVPAQAAPNNRKS